MGLVIIVGIVDGYGSFEEFCFQLVLCRELKTIRPNYIFAYLSQMQRGVSPSAEGDQSGFAPLETPPPFVKGGRKL